MRDFRRAEAVAPCEVQLNVCGGDLANLSVGKADSSPIRGAFKRGLTNKIPGTIMRTNYFGGYDDVRH